MIATYRLLALAGSSGRALLAWVATMNQWALVLLIGAFVLDHLLARRVRASWRVALYAPLALRLMLPRGWTVPVVHPPHVVTLLTPVPVDLPPPPEGALTAPSLGWPAVAIFVYTAVALALAYSILCRRAAARLVLDSCRPLAMGRRSAEARSLPCPVVEHDDAGPMVVGLFSPHIVLPLALVQAGDAFAIASVLRHEVAHLERRDAWLSVGMQALLAIAWPVLPLWVACWRVRQLMELACDEGALASADATERQHYGHALLDMAEWRGALLTPIDAELHFGSTLRARIEALGLTSRWPVAAQVGLVVTVATGFAACSSMPGSSRASEGEPVASLVTAWTPPPADEPLWSMSNDDHGRPSIAVAKYCRPFVDAVERADAARHYESRDWAADWMKTDTAGLPAEQVAFCMTPKVAGVAALGFWAMEARNALGQIGKDTNAAFEKRAAAGDSSLCPSAPPVPRTLQAPDTSHRQTAPSEWNDHEGWECLRFAFSVPTFFQYRMDNDPTHLVATAHGQRSLDGRVIDVTMVLRGTVENERFWVSPYIEESWKTLD